MFQQSSSPQLEVVSVLTDFKRGSEQVIDNRFNALYRNDSLEIHTCADV
jgi:hypothetical protein